MKKKHVKQETQRQKAQRTLNEHYDAGFEDGRRSGLAEAANVLMEHRDREHSVGWKIAKGLFDAPR